MVQSSVSQRVNRSKRLVSIKDIAKEAGVSVCTVSLVMNNKDHNRVSKAVAQKIRAIAENMGTSLIPWRAPYAPANPILWDSSPMR